MSAQQEVAEYRELALGVFRQKFGDLIADVVVQEGIDHQEEPALFFEVQIGAAAPVPLGPNFIWAHVDLRRALEELGETRFPYLSTRRTGGGSGEVVSRYPEGAVAKKRAY